MISANQPPPYPFFDGPFKKELASWIFQYDSEFHNSLSGSDLMMFTLEHAIKAFDQLEFSSAELYYAPTDPLIATCIDECIAYSKQYNLCSINVKFDWMLFHPYPKDEFPTLFQVKEIIELTASDTDRYTGEPKGGWFSLLSLLFYDTFSYSERHNNQKSQQFTIPMVNTAKLNKDRLKTGLLRFENASHCTINSWENGYYNTYRYGILSTPSYGTL